MRGRVRLLCLLVVIAVVTNQRPAVAGDAPDPWPEEGSVTVLLTGDMLIHSGVSRTAAANGDATGFDFDFRPMFDRVRSVIEAADLAICHQEVQLGVPGTPMSPFPKIAAPAEFATALADAGYDGCSTASNHATDHGDDGLLSTIAALDTAGIRHTGTAATQAASGGTIYDLGAVAIGHLSYTYAVQSFSPEHPWSVNLIDEASIVSDAKALEASGADFVIVSLHWGVEFRHQPTAEQRRLARDLTRSGAIDLVVGHHAHVLQPIEWINGKPVIFGLGNFLSNMGSSCCGGSGAQDGAAVLVRLRPIDGRWRVWSIGYMPTWVERGSGGYTIWPAIGAEGGPADALSASSRRTEGYLTIDGQTRPGLSAEGAVGWLTTDRLMERLTLAS
jgi:Bacterial capsule synthesis protein PGA_cap